MRAAIGSFAAAVRRWWEPTCPTNHAWVWMIESPWRGWRAPVVEVSRELQEDFPEAFADNLSHILVHHDFDRDLDVFVWWPLWPTHRLAYWWFAGRGGRFRWCIERWAKWHVFDVEEGGYLSDWRWRPLREWTWRRSYYRRSGVGPFGLPRTLWYLS